MSFESIKLAGRTFLRFPISGRIRSLNLLPLTVFFSNELLSRMSDCHRELENISANFHNAMYIPSLGKQYKKTLQELKNFGEKERISRHLGPIYLEFLQKTPNDDSIWNWDFQKDFSRLKNYLCKKKIHLQEIIQFNQNFVHLTENIRMRHKNAIRDIGKCI
jgi:hypothetical protein